MTQASPDFMKQVVVDITPSAQGQETILATFAGSILSDVKASRRSANVELLQQVVDLAYIAGVRMASTNRSQAAIGETRQRLQDLVR